MSETTPDPWLSALRQGDRRAFEQVYARERKALYGFLVRLCRDGNVASDLFQNTWLKLARGARELREDTDIRAWLFTVARNEYRSYCRAQALDLSRLLTLGLDTPDLAVSAPGANAGAAAIEAALGALGDTERELLLLVGVEGLELQEAAQVMGISYAALRQRLVRARKRLVELLDGRDPAAGATARKAVEP